MPNPQCPKAPESGRRAFSGAFGRLRGCAASMNLLFRAPRPQREQARSGALSCAQGMLFRRFLARADLAVL
eukprot:11063686-Alexandrium_andersonii.AAC.1